MVEQVTGWRASDGKLFDSQLEALKHDAYVQLSKLDIFNHASALAIIENAVPVMRALRPLFEEQNDA